MQFASGKDDVLAGLLLEGFNARVCLTEQFHASDELRHIGGHLRLQRNSNDRRYLQYTFREPQYWKRN